MGWRTFFAQTFDLETCSWTFDIHPVKKDFCSQDFVPWNFVLKWIFVPFKGQIISKGLFGILEFSQKTNSFARFLGEFEDTKKSFRNCTFVPFVSHRTFDHQPQHFFACFPHSCWKQPFQRLLFQSSQQKSTRFWFQNLFIYGHLISMSLLDSLKSY